MQAFEAEAEAIVLFDEYWIKMPLSVGKVKIFQDILM